jgi:hypothetical protein
MPHMIDRHIIDALHARWPEEFNKTSSHRFRTGQDMQFAFSYMYFMMRQVPCRPPPLHTALVGYVRPTGAGGGGIRNPRPR